jgi:hypothetical protein
VASRLHTSCRADALTARHRRLGHARSGGRPVAALARTTDTAARFSQWFRAFFALCYAIIHVTGRPRPFCLHTVPFVACRTSATRTRSVSARAARFAQSSRPAWLPRSQPSSWGVQPPAARPAWPSRCRRAVPGKRRRVLADGSPAGLNDRIQPGHVRPEPGDGTLCLLDSDHPGAACLDELATRRVCLL